jgi:pilus assembly protein Flp/PilA
MHNKTIRRRRGPPHNNPPPASFAISREGIGPHKYYTRIQIADSGINCHLQLFGVIIVSKLLRFWKDESGASAAEYALILAIVGVGITTAATGLKGAIAGAMNNAATTINNNS